MITKYSKLGISMSMPREFGICNGGKNAYMLLTWIEVSIPYCIGQIDAYFDDDIPDDFWIANAVYVAQASLFSIKWAEKFGQEDIDGMVKRARISFENYDDFRLNIPKWYTNEYRTKYKDVVN